MLERFGVTEETWREGTKKDKTFGNQGPLFVGRAVAALAGDTAILLRPGQLSSWELTASMLQLLRTGSEIRLRWLSELTQKTKTLLKPVTH